MAENYRIHPLALGEYEEAARYYLSEASNEVATGFVREVEMAIADIVSVPHRWRVVEAPDVRRFLLR